MQILLLSSAALFGLTAAAPQGTGKQHGGPICPTPDFNICVNSTAAKLPATQVHGYTQYNVAKYKEWPSTQDFNGCQAKCKDDPGCKSFRLYFQGPGLTSSAFMCNLHNHSVASYQIDCNADGAESGVTYFDKDCETPRPLKKGKVPDSPGTDDFTGTCNGARSWNQDQYQIIRDVVEVEEPFKDQSLQECSEACQQKHDCKSYLYSNKTSPAYQAPNQGGQEPYGDGGFGPANCLLLSQPVSKLTVDGGNLGADYFYDRNCPI